MSGLFKVLTNIIPSKNFAAKSHNYILKNCGQKFLAACYYDPQDRIRGRLQQGHNHDIFEMSTVSYSLQRQTTAYQNTLNSIEEDEQKFAPLKANIENEINANENVQSSFNYEIVKMLEGKLNTSNISIGTASEIVFILANSQYENAQQIVKEHVIPVILKKINYASTQNLIDIVVGFNSLNLLSEKAAVDAVIGQIESSKFTWELEQVAYHGWETNAYENSPPKKSVNVNEYDQQYRELRISDIAWRAGTLKRFAQRELNYQILNRFLWRENRVFHEFEPINQSNEVEAFKAALSGLGAEHAGAKKKIEDRLA